MTGPVLIPLAPAATPGAGAGAGAQSAYDKAVAEAVALTVGDTVEVIFGDTSPPAWFPAAVTKVHPAAAPGQEPLYDVTFDDGDTAARVSRLKIRRAGEKQARVLAVGQAVLARCTVKTEAGKAPAQGVGKDKDEAAAFAGRAKVVRGTVLGGPLLAHVNEAGEVVDGPGDGKERREMVSDVYEVEFALSGADIGASAAAAPSMVITVKVCLVRPAWTSPRPLTSRPVTPPLPPLAALVG